MAILSVDKIRLETNCTSMYFRCKALHSIQSHCNAMAIVCGPIAIRCNPIAHQCNCIAARCCSIAIRHTRIAIRSYFNVKSSARLYPLQSNCEGFEFDCKHISIAFRPTSIHVVYNSLDAVPLQSACILTQTLQSDANAVRLHCDSNANH
jgi:hypothetical protein